MLLQCSAFSGLNVVIKHLTYKFVLFLKQNPSGDLYCHVCCSLPFSVSFLLCPASFGLSIGGDSPCHHDRTKANSKMYGDNYIRPVIPVVFPCRLHRRLQFCPLQHFKGLSCEYICWLLSKYISYLQ